MTPAVIVNVKNEKDRRELNRLVKATNKSDPKPEDIQALNKILDEQPDVWKTIGELAVQAQSRSISNNFGSSEIAKESVRRRLREMRDNLGWSEASELEKLLIRQVCLCWLNYHVAEIRRHDTTRGQHSMREGVYWEKAVLASQKRYLRAIETLTKMQKIIAQTKAIQARADEAKASQALKAAKLLDALNED